MDVEGYLTTLRTINGDIIEVDERNNRARMNAGDWQLYETFEIIKPSHALIVWDLSQRLVSLRTIV